MAYTITDTDHSYSSYVQWSTEAVYTRPRDQGLSQPALGQWPVSWRPTAVKWRQLSQSNSHSTIGTRQTEYHEALPSSANDEVRCDCTFVDDGNASWYSVCRAPMVEWRLDCENCRHLTVVGLHDTGFRSDCLLAACLTSQQNASISQGRICVLQWQIKLSISPCCIPNPTSAIQSSAVVVYWQLDNRTSAAALDHLRATQKGNLARPHSRSPQALRY